MLDLFAAKTALILVDLQQGIVSRSAFAPRSGTEVAVTGAKLAERFRAAGSPVVLVNVSFAPDFGDGLGGGRVVGG